MPKFDELNQLKRFFSTMDISDDEKKKRTDLAYLLYDAIYFTFAIIKVEKEIEERNFTRNALLAEQYKETLESRIENALVSEGIRYELEYIKKLTSDIISNRPVFDNIKDEKVAEIVRQILNDTDKNTDSYFDTLKNRLTDAFSQNGIPIEDNYINQLVIDLIETTNRHPDDPYYLSKERALLIAQNEANTAYNYSDYVNAKSEGKTHKTWITEGDEKVREAHVEVDMQTIPIDDYFLVGGDTMRYPHDYINASPGNIINCRCVCIYE